MPIFIHPEAQRLATLWFEKTYIEPRPNCPNCGKKMLGYIGHGKINCLECDTTVDYRWLENKMVVVDSEGNLSTHS